MYVTPSGNDAYNPFAGVITPQLHNLWTGAINSLLEPGALTVPCTLIYGNVHFVECTNCVNKTYKAGGPVPFPRGGMCPLCGGRDRETVEATECLNLIVIFDRAQFRVLRGVNTDDDYAETMCHIKYWNKIVGCEYAILDSCNEDQTNSRFCRYGKPMRCGLGKQEFIIVPWRRAA